MAKDAKIQNGGWIKPPEGDSARGLFHVRFGRKVKGGENLWRRCLNLRIDKNHEGLRQPNRRPEFVADTPDRSGFGKKTSKDIRPSRLSRS